MVKNALISIAVTIKKAAKSWLLNFFSDFTESKKTEKSKNKITIITAKKLIMESYS